MLSLLLPACLFSAGRIELVGDGPQGPQITFVGASGQTYFTAGEGGTTLETASEFTAKDVYVETSEMGLAEALGKIGTMETQVAELYGLVQNLTAAVAAGGGGAPADLPLANGVHLSSDCESQLGGTALGEVFDTGDGVLACQFPASSCPGGWTQYESWSQTTSSSCTGGYNDYACITTRGSCSTGGHEWSNVAQESCYAGNSCHNTACANAPHQYVNGVACCTGSFCGSAHCTATVEIVGCY